jgi:hypothetical protein
LIVKHAAELVPGEAVAELIAAWEHGEGSYKAFIEALCPIDPSPPKQGPRSSNVDISKTLAANHLTGPSGKAKRSLLRRLIDAVRMSLAALPLTDVRRRLTMESGADCAEFGAAIANSARDLPGAHTVEELLMLVRQLLNIRARRESVATERPGGLAGA